MTTQHLSGNTPASPSTMNGLKAFACGVVALALTAGFSWTFVKSSAVAHVGGGVPATMLAGSALPTHLG
jgi:hypothetical protein